MVLACLASFFLGAIATMWTLNRIGRHLQRKAQEREAQIIQRAFYEQLNTNHMTDSRVTEIIADITSKPPNYFFKTVDTATGRWVSLIPACLDESNMDDFLDLCNESKCSQYQLVQITKGEFNDLSKSICDSFNYKYNPL